MEIDKHIEKVVHLHWQKNQKYHESGEGALAAAIGRVLFLKFYYCFLLTILFIPVWIVLKSHFASFPKAHLLVVMVELVLILF